MRRLEIKGLTLSQPWPWAMRDLGKDVENRNWRPPRGLVSRGLLVALHGGRRKSWRSLSEDVTAIARITGTDPAEELLVPQIEGIFSVGRIGAVVTPLDAPSVLPPDQVRWFFGDYGWLMVDRVTLLEPVPCKGALGLWKLPDDVLERVRAGYLAATRTTGSPHG